MSVSVPDTASKPHKGFRLDLKTAGPLLALILLIILGYGLNPLFLGEGNVTNLLTPLGVYRHHRGWRHLRHHRRRHRPVGRLHGRLHCRHDDHHNECRGR